LVQPETPFLPALIWL